METASYECYTSRGGTSAKIHRVRFDLRGPALHWEVPRGGTAEHLVEEGVVHWFLRPKKHPGRGPGEFRGQNNRRGGKIRGMKSSKKQQNKKVNVAKLKGA